MKIYPYLVTYARPDSRGFVASGVASYHLTRSGATRAAKQGKAGHVSAVYVRDPFQLKSDDLPVWAGCFRDHYANHYHRIG